MDRRSFAVLGALACSSTFASLEAHANGRLPRAHQLVFSATDPGFVAIEATFGLFLSQDTGAHFAWVCEPAIGYPSTLNWDPSIGITSTSILAGTPHGVSVSPDVRGGSSDAGPAKQRKRALAGCGKKQACKKVAEFVHC